MTTLKIKQFLVSNNALYQIMPFGWSEFFLWLHSVAEQCRNHHLQVGEGGIMSPALQALEKVKIPGYAWYSWRIKAGFQLCIVHIQGLLLLN